MNEIKNLKIVKPKELLEIHNVVGVPDVVKLIRRCGLTVMGFVPETVTDKEIRKVGNIQGYISIDHSSKIILFNYNLLPTARRFVVGYLFSYYQLYLTEKSEYYSFLYQESIYDRKAYNYTLDLLMPDDIFDSKIVNSNKDIEKLAKKYDVSEFLIHQKIENLEKRKKLTLV